MNKKLIFNEILLFIATIIWGIAFSFQEIGMRSIGPITFSTFRCFIGAIFLILISLIDSLIKKKKKIEVKKYKKKDLIIGGVVIGSCTAIAMALQQIGISIEGAGKSGFITALYILFVPIIGLIFKKRTKFITIIAIAIAIVGLYLINYDGTSFTFGLGTIILLLCAVAFGFQISFIEYFSPKCDSIHLTAAQFLVACIFQIPFMFIFEQPTITGVIDATWSILFCGVLSSGVAFGIQIYTQKTIPANSASMIMSLESVFSLIFAIFILNEKMNYLQYIGCFIIFVAIILNQIVFKKPKKESISDS